MDTTDPKDTRSRADRIADIKAAAHADCTCCSVCGRGYDWRAR